MTAGRRGWRAKWRWPWEFKPARTGSQIFDGLERLRARSRRGKVWFYRDDGEPSGECRKGITGR